jgi:hypothetical protein
MPFYTVQHRYSARNGEQTFGPWEGGETVDLTEDEADWVNRDSAGCLEAATPDTPKKPERQQPKTADRQHRGGSNRSN